MFSSAEPQQQDGALAVDELNARRRRAVALRLEGCTLAQAAQDSGLSVPTVVAAHKAWQRGGWAAVDVRPRGRKPLGERLLTAEEEAALCEEWSAPTVGVWTLKRAVAHACAVHPALQTLAPTQIEPMITRLWQRAGLVPPNRWDEWRAVTQGPLADWWQHELPGLRQLAREADVTLLALNERTLPGRAACQLAAHSGRGTASWRITAAWPAQHDWLAFWQALRQEVGQPVWLLTDNPWLSRTPALTTWLADAAHGVRLIHPPAQRPVVPEPSVFAAQ